jgi:hypothetical protein
MQLAYGSYSWAASSVVCKTDCTPVLNAAGMPMRLKTRMSVSGSLLTSTASTTPNADLTAAQIAMQIALNVPYKDLILFTNDEGNGVGPSATLLTNAGSLSGVRLVAGPTWSGDRGDAEYAVQRKFNFTMEVETLFPNRFSALMSFSESLSYSGGMPIKVMALSVNLPPIDQTTWPLTPFEAIQSGQAIGLLAWPFGSPTAMPPYRFPASMLRKAPNVEASGPDRIGPTTYINYGVKWSATYASALPLIAAPTLWTN